MLLLESAFNWFNGEVEELTTVELNSLKDCSSKLMKNGLRMIKITTTLQKVHHK